jgi:hypothetical protein
VHASDYHNQLVSTETELNGHDGDYVRMSDGARIVDDVGQSVGFVA